MASTRPHFRVALGTSSGRPSLLVQSRRGIYRSARLRLARRGTEPLGRRSGIPDVLERLLGMLAPSDIIDFALGPQDQFWISYKSPKGRTYWGDYNFWAVTEDASGQLSASWDVGSSELEDAISNISESSALDDIKFLTLGNRDSYVYGTKSSLSWSGVQPSLAALLRGAKRDDLQVSNVVLCPGHADRWFVEFENASVNYSLPGFDSAALSLHTSPDASLRSTGAVVAPSIVVAKTSPSVATTTLGVLRPNDHMHRTVAKLFYDGWKHASKRMAVIRDIYSITMPPSITKAYGLYKASLQSRKGGRAMSYTPTIEKRVFHGTRRSCLIGNNPLKPDLCFSGNAYYITRTNEKLKEPPTGYDSVFGEVGDDLNYDEQVVYRNDAILPAFLIVDQP
ncbi:hypothetical protein FS837_009255 [Tulasnella sp. UAMH 9824]|nr:hypothetical protein FS837_009255 [Tulasnella sp. UAMH 9824]